MVVTPDGAVMLSDWKNAVPVCAENAPPGTVGATATGAGVAALGVGVGFVVASNDALDRAKSPATTTHADYARLYALADHRRTVGIVTVVGGASVLACGLAVMVFSDLPSLRLFGWLSAFAMMAALTADLLILRPTAMFVNQIAARFSKK